MKNFSKILFLFSFITITATAANASSQLECRPTKNFGMFENIPDEIEVGDNVILNFDKTTQHYKFQVPTILKSDVEVAKHYNYPQVQFHINNYEGKLTKMLNTNSYSDLSANIGYSIIVTPTSYGSKVSLSVYANANTFDGEYYEFFCE
jgi:hypothetical protein